MSEPIHLSGLPDRFQISATLGRGAQKTVYRAEDSLLQRSVAIAAIPLQSGDRRGIREARAMARISDHPRIVTIFDVIHADDFLYLVTGYMNGGDLGARIRHPSRGDLEYNAWTQRVAVQITEGLSHVHDKGLIHGDLKPTNILLDDKNDAHIADFGLSKLIRSSSQTSTGVGGTPAYLAPEIIRGEAANELSDLYALGCVLYELFSGQPAFQGRTVAELLQKQLHTEPDHHALSAELPDTTRDLLLKMLDKDPSGRPQSSSEVFDSLIGAPSDKPASAPGVVTNTPRPIELIGRRAELMGLLDTLERAESGTPSLTLIFGEPGIGKTSLATALESQANEHGFVCCWGHAHEQGTFPYRPIVEALRPQSGALRLLSDGIGEFLETGATPPGQGGEDYQQFHFAVGDAVSALVSRRKMLIVFDDLHWADEGSLDLIHSILATCSASRSPQRLMMIGCVRHERTSPAFERWLVRVRSRFELGEVNVSGLSELEVRELIRRSDDADLSELAISQLFEISDGNPLHIVEALRRPLSGTSSEAARSHTGLTQVVNAKVKALTQPTQDLLTLASCFPSDVEVQELTRVSEMSEEDFWNALAEAEEAGLIRVDDTELNFVHPVFRTALYESRGPINRQRMHARIASMLSDDGTPPSGRLLLQTVHHLHRAARFAPTQKLVQLADAASRYAFDIGSWDNAVTYSELALSLSADSDELDHGALHYRAALASMTLQDRTAGLKHIDSAIEAFQSAGDTKGYADALRRRLVMISQRDSGSVDTEELELALNELGCADNEAKARVLYTLADLRLDQNRPEESLGLASEARSLGVYQDDHHFQSVLDNVIGGAHLQRLELSSAVEAYTRALGKARLCPNEWVSSYALNRLPRPLVLSGRFTEAEPLLREAKHVNLKVRNFSGLTMALALELTIELARGNLANVREISDEAAAVIRRADFAPTAGEIVFASACGDFLAGNSDGALKQIDHLVKPGALISNPAPYASIASLHRAFIALHSGEAVSDVVFRTPRRSLDPSRLNRLCLNVEIAAKLHDPSRIRDMIRWLETAADSGVNFTLGWLFCIPRVLGLALAVVKEYDRAETWFEKALSVTELASANVEHALTQRQLADALRARDTKGDQSRAAELSAQARSYLDDLRKEAELSRSRRLDRSL